MIPTALIALVSLGLPLRFKPPEPVLVVAAGMVGYSFDTRVAVAGERETEMKWVTRANVKVDRVACPWLIVNFVDPQAEFIFVPPRRSLRSWKHRGDPLRCLGCRTLWAPHAECSFDAILKKYNLSDPALQQLALIVRGADTADKDLTPESRGLEAVAEGFRRRAGPGGWPRRPRDEPPRSGSSTTRFYLFCGGDAAKITRA